MKTVLDGIKKNAAEHAIFLAACVLCLCVYPFGIIGHSEYVNESVNEGLSVSAGIENGMTLEGSFTPAHERLDSLAVRFSTRDMNIVDGVLHFTLYDSEGDVIDAQNVSCTEIRNNEYHEFKLDRKLDTSRQYRYTLETTDSSQGVPRIYIGSGAIGPKEQEGLLFNGAELGKSMPLRFRYTGKPSGKKVLVYDICILLAAMLLLFGIKRKTGDKAGARLSAGGVYRYLCFAVIAVMLIFVGDESDKPLRIGGCDLKHDVGAVEWDYLVIGEGSGYAGAWASMNTYALNGGSYSVGVAYGAQTEDNKLVITDNGKVIVEQTLPTSETYIEVPFELAHDSQEIAVRLWYGGTGYLYAYSMSLRSETGFYNDAVYYAVVFCLLQILAVGYALLRMKKKFLPESARKEPAPAKVVIILTAVGLFSFLPYLNGSLPWGDDLCYHLIRIEGIRDGIRDGQFPVMIYPEGLNGYGYLNCMYPYLFLYIPAFIRLCGVSIAASYKTLIFLFAMLTVFVTYYSVKSIYPSTKAAIMAAVLYTCCPYRYTNVYARGAVGEALAMTFVPLLVAGLYHVLAGKRKKWRLLALGLTGLLQTHVLSAMLGGILCVVVGMLFLYRVFADKRYIEIGKAALMTVLLNLWYLVPFMHYFRSGKLWTDSLKYSTYSEWSLNLSGLAGNHGGGDYRTLALGIPVIVCAGIAGFYLIMQGRDKSGPEQEGGQKRAAYAAERARYLRILLAFGVVCVFLLSGQFGAWEFMRLPAFEWLFSNIQFPWRLLGMASAFFIIAGSIALFASFHLRNYARPVAVALCVLCLFLTARYQEDDFAYQDYTSVYTQGHESKIVGIPKSDVTIVYPYEWRREGLTDDLLIPEAVRVTDADAVQITGYKRAGTTTTISYVSASDDAIVEFPVQYYDGYRAKNEDGKAVAVAPGEDQLVSFKTDGDGQEHTVVLSFHKKPLFTAAVVISALSVIFYLCWYPLCRCVFIKSKRGREEQGAAERKTKA